MAAGVTYEPISTITLTNSTTSSFGFSSIPNTYTDLRVVIVAAQTQGSGNVQFRFNGDTATNYSTTYLEGSGTSAYSGLTTSVSSARYAPTLPSTANNFGVGVIDIFNYTGSNFKTTISLGGSDMNSNNNGYFTSSTSLWRSTAAINQITFITGNLASIYYTSGTTATLYGITKA